MLKLDEAKVMIDMMQEQLENMKPILEEKTKQVERTTKRLEKETKEVQAVKEVVDAEAAAVQAQVNIAEEMKAECQERLSVAEPYFERAIKALRTLTSSDFVLMKSFTNPPPGVRLALEAMCVMLGKTPKWVKKDGQKTADYWEVSKKLIGNYKKLIETLENYPKENVDPKIIAKIQPYLGDENFWEENIKKASEAAEGICKWVKAIVKFDEIYKEITPKREALKAAEEKVAVVQEQLAGKKAELQKLIDQNAELLDESKQ